MPGGKSEPEQLSIYLAYRSFMAAGGGPLSGRLLLLFSPERALAATVAGGASLLVMFDAAAAKAALRAGCCNFLVSSLDEAVRILKNEVRREAAVSVGLHAAVSDTERSCVERGLQPDLLEHGEPTLEARGARAVPWQTALQEGERFVHWSAPSGNFQVLRALQTLAFQCIAERDAERRRWLAQAPAVLGRPGQGGGVPMYDEEIERLRAGLQGAPDASACVVHGDGSQLWPPIARPLR